MPRHKQPDKAGKKVVKKTVQKKSEPTPVAPVVEPVNVKSVGASEEPPSVPQMSDDFSQFMTKLQQATALLSSLRQDFRALEKKATRELKMANKNAAKRKRKQGNRSPSGFVKPTLISNELAAFLGKEVGTEMARTEVTREINAYIRKHSLQDKQNGRKIIPDTSLTKLLKLGKTDELTYFNLQKYMSPHFAKAGQALPQASL